MSYCREHGNTLTSSNIYKPLEMTCNCSHVWVQLPTDSLLWTKKAAQPMQMAWSNHKSPDFSRRFKLGVWTTNSKELGTAQQVSRLPHGQNQPSTSTPNLYQSKFFEASETRNEESFLCHLTTGTLPILPCKLVASLIRCHMLMSSDTGSMSGSILSIEGKSNMQNQAGNTKNKL